MTKIMCQSGDRGPVPKTSATRRVDNRSIWEQCSVKHLRAQLRVTVWYRIFYWEFAFWLQRSGIPGVVRISIEVCARLLCVTGVLTLPGVVILQIALQITTSISQHRKATMTVRMSPPHVLDRLEKAMRSTRDFSAEI